MLDKDGNDYSADSLPSFPDGLKGNSAEGFVIEQGMKGYGSTAAPARHPAEGGDAPGAFIQGNNSFNNVSAGKAGSTSSEESKD